MHRWCGSHHFAGRLFIERLYESEETQQKIREIYQENFRALCAGDSTEKQAMAAAAIITADLCATAWIFKDDSALTVSDIQEFLASREAVSAGRRAYEWISDWVSSNVNRFMGGESPPTGEVYGAIEPGKAFIIRGVFNNAVQNAGFSVAATLSYMRSNKLIETRGRAYTKPKKINGIPVECVVMALQLKQGEEDDCDELPL